MSGRGRTERKVVRLDMSRVRSNGTRQRVKLTEAERQVLLAELARVTAELHGLQVRTMDLTSRVLNTSGTGEARTG
jgi:hypothetical protein